MNQHMMQFGNQPTGYPQSGNYPGSYAPPGGGPPPPPNSNMQPGSFPPPRQFGPGVSHATTQSNNLPTSTSSTNPAGFVVPPGSQGPPPVTASGIKPPGYQGPHFPQPSGPVMPPAQGLPLPGQFHNNPSASQVPQPPPSMGPTGDHLSGPPISQGPRPFMRPPGPSMTPVSQTMLNGPPGAPPVSSPHGLSGPPMSNVMPGVRGQSYEPPFTNGSPSMMPPQNSNLHSSGPIDANKQVSL